MKQGIHPNYVDCTITCEMCIRDRCEGLLPPKHDAGTATRHYRAFWQRRCRAAEMCIRDSSHADLTDDYAAVRREMEMELNLGIFCEVYSNMSEMIFMEKAGCQNAR